MRCWPDITAARAAAGADGAATQARVSPHPWSVRHRGRLLAGGRV